MNAVWAEGERVHGVECLCVAEHEERVRRHGAREVLRRSSRALARGGAPRPTLQGRLGHGTCEQQPFAVGAPLRTLGAGRVIRELVGIAPIRGDDKHLGGTLYGLYVGEESPVGMPGGLTKIAAPPDEQCRWPAPGRAGDVQLRAVDGCGAGRRTSVGNHATHRVGNRSAARRENNVAHFLHPVQVLGLNGTCPLGLGVGQGGGAQKSGDEETKQNEALSPCRSPRSVS